MQKRIYKKGRPTIFWTRGKLVRKLTDVKVGDVLFSVNDWLQAQNLVKVVSRPHDDKFYVAYARLSGRIWGKSDGNDGARMCVWHFELKSKRSDNGCRYFKAVRGMPIL